MASITLNSNIAALNAQRRLANSTGALRNAYSSLSSGLRINKASDDAAGLAISTSLNTDRRVYDQGQRNLNDGISLLSIADGALEQLSNIVVRLSELAEQAANGGLQTPQRKALDSEAQALKAEFSRITATTQFNGLNLLAGSLGNVRLQTGFGANSILESNLGGAIGNGSFQGNITDSQITGASFAVFAMDFNGDGFADILNAGNIGINTRFNVSLGDGQGSFSTATSFSLAMAGPARNASLGDLNNDGILDVVLGGGPSTLVLLGNGDGTFRAPLSFTSSLAYQASTTVADVNNDGVMDLLIGGSNSSGDPAQQIMLGNGNGTFRVGLSYSNSAFSTWNVVSIALSDVNGDGVLDMFSSFDGSTNGAAVEYRLGNGQGGFGAETNYFTSSIDGGPIVLADINNDKQLDWIQYAQDFDQITYAYIGLGNGNGTFRNPTATVVNDGSASGIVNAFQVADFNGDGNLDIYGDNMLLFGNGNGTFSAQKTLSMPSASSATDAADINGDGVLDLINVTTAGRAYHSLQSVTSGTAPLLDFSLATLADARQALPQFRQKLSQLATQRGTIGSFQSRIGTALANSATLSLNVAAAASQISNVDVAEAAADLLKQKILQQVGVAILAQANQAPALALRVLELGKR